jgi:UDP-GlcNAc:undecaprenyl-phosphate/decaprenyl-phosphate GlcNAc-1-phosphate transferase
MPIFALQPQSYSDERVIAAILAVLIALLASFGLTAVVRAIALRLGSTGRSDDCLEPHRKKAASGGGVAVYGAAAAVLAAMLAVPNPYQADLLAVRGELVGLLLAGAVIVLVGLLDDRFHLRGRQKLLGQIVAASILVANGLVVQKVGLFGLQIELGLLAVPFTLFWLVGTINAVNLLDGMDGLAATMGIILTSALAGIAMMTQRVPIALIAVVFAGSLGGFLRFNLPPAKVLLGDAGSMLVGLVIGALAIQGSLKGAGAALLASSLALCAVPLLDCAAAIVRQKLTGRSGYAADRAHLHHCLMNRLGNSRTVLGWLAGCCVVTSLAACASVFYKSDLVALAVCTAVVVLFVATGLFGRAELRLVLARLRKVACALLPNPVARTGQGSQQSLPLAGSREWAFLWAALTESADKLHLCRLDLDVHLPMMHEGYAARWETPAAVDADDFWHLEFPLTVAQQHVGRLAIAGDRNGGTLSDDLGPLLEMIEPLESQLRAIAEDEIQDEPQREMAASGAPL